MKRPKGYLSRSNDNNCNKNVIKNAFRSEGTSSMGYDVPAINFSNSYRSSQAEKVKR